MKKQEANEIKKTQAFKETIGLLINALDKKLEVLRKEDPRADEKEKEEDEAEGHDVQEDGATLDWALSRAREISSCLKDNTPAEIQEQVRLVLLDWPNLNEERYSDIADQIEALYSLFV